MKTNQNNRPLSEKGYFTVDHLQTISQLIKQCNEFSKPICTGYNYYEKAFDSIAHEAVFKALRTLSVKETYVTVLEDIYTGATARVHIWIIKSQRDYQC